MEGVIFISAILLLVFLAIMLTFIPFIVAFKREHTYKWVILVLCLFSPTVVIWLAGLCWAVWPDPEHTFTKETK